MRAQPPGPAGYPVVGNTYHYARDPLAFMDAVRRAYGDVARFTLGPVDAYMLSNPDDVERVLVTEEPTFRKADFADEAVEALLGKGLLLSDGVFWEEQRHLAQPAFNMGRISGLVEMMTEKTAATLDGWTDGETVNLQLPIARLTVEIIVEAMFGAGIDERTVRTVQDNLEPLGARFEPDPVRFLTPSWMPSAGNREYYEALSTLEGIVEDLIERRRGTETGRTDLLSILLRAQARGDQTDRQLRDEMMTMLLAGHDTTALTLTYAFHQVGCHPEVERRLHEEVDRVLGDARTSESARSGEERLRPAMADLRRLDYTERVLKETMRVLPPVYTLFRQANADVRVGGYRVPKDALVMLPQWVVHRDPAYWDDPEAFDPDRWLPERARLRHRYAYFPFGAGPRHCIGKQFSMVEAKAIASMIASRFSLELRSDRELSLRPSLTMHPRDPIEVRLRAR
ncbi:cytochrome P450 [Halomarina halobia]|uniref:Cytochrome P450 n=1 Tax=Halomarina halobia TaxID=3033386 RepID=A0ABD6A5F8_9EURY|nr:cytochrome P450 [Halomarina sp. PSR21]